MLKHSLGTVHSVQVYVFRFCFQRWETTVWFTLIRSYTHPMFLAMKPEMSSGQLKLNVTSRKQWWQLPTFTMITTIQHLTWQLSDLTWQVSEAMTSEWPSTAIPILYTKLLGASYMYLFGHRCTPRFVTKAYTLHVPTRVKPCCVLEHGTFTPQKYW